MVVGTVAVRAVVPEVIVVVWKLTVLDGTTTMTAVEATPLTVVGTKVVKPMLPEVVVRVERLGVGTTT